MFVASFALATALSATDVPAFLVRVDAARHEIVFRLGPFQLPASASGGEHAGMHHHGLEMPVFRFILPAGGWIRGFRVSLFDAEGRALPRRILHHVNLLHLGRRQLTQPILERTLAAGQETDDVILPKSVGVRLDAGAEMALLTAWANETGADLDSVILELRLPYLADNTMPRPQEVRPVAFDVGFRPGLSDGFDLDTGRTVHRREFVVPIDGRLLAVGGHLHDYAESLQLREVATGRVIVALEPTVDARGRISQVSRKIFGISGAGRKLKAGRYVVEAVYNNRTGARIENGGMAVLGGIFAPDDPKRWPAVDRNDAVFAADAAGLDRIGWVMVGAAGAGKLADVRRQP
jgi:hypothetical protein